MSGSQQRDDRGLCWNCGKSGLYDGGGRMTCLECEVTWTAWPSAARSDLNRVCWMGKPIDYVDFHKAGRTWGSGVTGRSDRLFLSEIPGFYYPANRERSTGKAQ